MVTAAVCLRWSTSRSDLARRGSVAPVGFAAGLLPCTRQRLHSEYIREFSDDRHALLEVIPDVRDGLTRTERIILYVLQETQRELNGRNVPTAMLYGRVLEYVDMSEAELHLYLDRLGVKGDGSQG